MLGLIPGSNVPSQLHFYRETGFNCAGLWFGGDDAVVDWTPALKGWLHE
jgi:hypothetical protein